MVVAVGTKSGDRRTESEVQIKESYQIWFPFIVHRWTVVIGRFRMLYCDPDSSYCFVYSLEDEQSEMTIEPILPQELLATKEEVPLGMGPPTRAELLAHYPARFTWSQLKTFVNSG